MRLGEVKKFLVVCFSRLFVSIFSKPVEFSLLQNHNSSGAATPQFACIDLSECGGRCHPPHHFVGSHGFSTEHLYGPMLYKAYSFTVEPDFVDPPPSSMNGSRDGKAFEPCSARLR